MGRNFYVGLNNCSYFLLIYIVTSLSHWMNIKVSFKAQVKILVLLIYYVFIMYKRVSILIIDGPPSLWHKYAGYCFFHNLCTRFRHSYVWIFNLILPCSFCRVYPNIDMTPLIIPPIPPPIIPPPPINPPIRPLSIPPPWPWLLFLLFCPHRPRLFQLFCCRRPWLFHLLPRWFWLCAGAAPAGLWPANKVRISYEW